MAGPGISSALSQIKPYWGSWRLISLKSNVKWIERWITPCFFTCFDAGVWCAFAAMNCASRYRRLFVFMGESSTARKIWFPFAARTQNAPGRVLYLCFFFVRCSLSAIVKIVNFETRSMNLSHFATRNASAQTYIAVLLHCASAPNCGVHLFHRTIGR